MKKFSKVGSLLYLLYHLTLELTFENFLRILTYFDKGHLMGCANHGTVATTGQNSQKSCLSFFSMVGVVASYLLRIFFDVLHQPRHSRNDLSKFWKILSTILFYGRCSGELSFGNMINSQKDSERCSQKIACYKRVLWSCSKLSFENFSGI